MGYLWELGYGNCFFIVKQPLLPKLFKIYMTQAKKKSHISSPSVPLTEVMTTGDQMKKTLLKIMGISVFEHC